MTAQTTTKVRTATQRDICLADLNNLLVIYNRSISSFIDRDVVSLLEGAVYSTGISGTEPLIASRKNI